MPLLRHRDPTITLTLRNLAIAEVNRRFAAISKVVRESIVTNRVLGNAEALPANAFAYMWDGQKVEAFKQWLDEQISDEILSVRSGNDPLRNWLNYYVGTGYEKGVAKARADLNKEINPAVWGVVGEALGAGLVMDSIFANPAHLERAELIYTRTFTDLKGVTEAMSTQMSRILANGIIRGENPEKIARELAERVDKIGKTRARLIARTEIVNAHQNATLQEAERIEAIIGKPMGVEWITMIDGLERPSHRARHGKIYTRKQAEALLGAPNCRCGIVAVVLENPKK